MKNLAAFICLISLSACSHTQPDYFSNGELDPVREQVFHSKLESVTEYFNALRSVGAQACLPGQVALIQRDINSVRLESRAQLWPEALMRLDRVTHDVDALLCQLQSVQNSTACSMNDDQSLPLTQWYLKANYSMCVADEEAQSVPHIMADITLFDSDSFELTEEARTSLTEWWQLIADIYAGPVLITGHTDARGSVDYNQTLSANRANAVADYLVSLGMKRTRMTVRAMGETQPRVEETNDFNRQLNRRVAVEADQIEEK